MPDTGTNEVLAYCGSCKMDLVAMVVAKVGSKIVKVQCNTCKKERAYKAPKGITEPGQVPAPKKPRKRATSAAEAAEARTVSVEAEWTRLMGEADKAATRVKYTPKTTLKLGDIVQHPSFGDGVVMRLIHPDKAELIFKTDMKLLIHSRS